MSKQIVIIEIGEVLQVLNERMTVLLSGAETEGKYTVVESVTQPNDGVPLLHTHPSQETIHVLEGKYEVYGRDEEGNKYAIPASAGSIVQIPGGTPHGFLNVGDAQGKILLTFEPAGMDDFFRDLGTPIDDSANPPNPDGPPDMEALLKTCAKYDIHFVEAPPA